MKIAKEVENAIKKEGVQYLTEYKKTYRICLDSMSMLSSDTHYLIALNQFLDFKLAEGVLAGMKLDTEIYNPVKRKEIDEKMKVF